MLCQYIFQKPQIKEERKLEKHATFLLHNAVIRYGFRKIRLHLALNEEQAVVLEIAECTKWEYKRIVMISLSDNKAWRHLRLTPRLSSCSFPAFSALKSLQDSYIIKNNSVTL